MSMYALLRNRPEPTMEQIMAALDGKPTFSKTFLRTSQQWYMQGMGGAQPRAEFLQPSPALIMWLCGLHHPVVAALHRNL